MPAKGKNYLTLERFSLRYLFYAFLDTGDYLADGLFIQHQVTVKFLQEYGHDDSPYLVIFCRIRKRDEAAFLDALEELPCVFSGIRPRFASDPARCRMTSGRQ